MDAALSKRPFACFHVVNIHEVLMRTRRKKDTFQTRILSVHWKSRDRCYSFSSHSEGSSHISCFVATDEESVYFDFYKSFLISLRRRILLVFGPSIDFQKNGLRNQILHIELPLTDQAPLTVSFSSNSVSTLFERALLEGGREAPRLNGSRG